MTFFKTLCCLLLFSFSMNAQELEVRAGGNLNQFYHFPQPPGRFSSDYTSGLGGHIGIGLPNLQVNNGGKPSFWGVYLHYDYYQGSLNNADGGRGGLYETNVEVKKHILGLAFYPLNLKLWQDKLRISLGPEAAVLLQDELIGSTLVAPSSVPIKQGVDYEDSESSSAMRAGLNAKFGLRIPIGTMGFLVPQYDFSWGLTREFADVQGNPRNLLHRISIGWVSSLNP